MFARDVIPNMLRGRSSSSSAISPFEFGEDDFPSVFVSQDNPYDSSFGTSAGAETIELLFGPYISDAPADFHVRNNRALAELVASDPDVTAADELSLCAFISAHHKTQFHNRVPSTKYRLWTFIPLNLWEQFHRIANLWFLLVVFVVLGGPTG
ncbi:hypothetical protein FOZ61_008825 [Perkinsus olseni]|uniref:P-type ATPase N-terminal domain-containing protein n=1 Tax=Perkinsus olseni TaxID=32597 RepID=A0A7J6M7M8_PEROL|nr:hypothetical protein FOZ61_008825 [Perkinsus olseni]